MLPGAWTPIELPCTSTGAPPTSIRSLVSVAVDDRATYQNGPGTGPVGGGGGDALMAATGPGQK
jgi:hypothetical protein